MSHTTKRVLIITMDYPPPFGGIATLTEKLESELKHAGHIVKVLNFDSRNTSNLKFLKAQDIFRTPATNNSYFSYKYVLNPANALKLERGLRDYIYNNLIYRTSKQEIDSFKPDLIHITHARLFASVYDTNVPFVVTCHSEEIHESFPVRFALEHASKIHCVSNFCKTRVEALVPQRVKDITVIHNSINPKKYHNLPISSRKHQIVSISRLTKPKNIETILKSLAIVNKNALRDLKYIVIGDGPERKNLEDLAATLKLDSIVSFTGQASEKRKIKILSESRLFILCPKPFNGEQEGFGIVYLEAQASGLPIIASQTGGIEDAVGKAGILIEKPTDTSLLAETIEYVLDNTSVQKRFIKEAGSRINNFSDKEWINSISKLYSGIQK